jgi:hypothetical protein
MSFLRHGESIDPMTLLPLGASDLAYSQCSSASMSSSRLFLGRLLSSSACLRFVGRQRFSKTKPRRTMILQQTATTPLTLCLTPRVHSKMDPPLLRTHSQPILTLTGPRPRARGEHSCERASVRSAL